MKLTPQQETFISELKAPGPNLRLDAVAGAGKTTTMKAGAKALSSPSIVCAAFNKRIAETLQKEMPPSAFCATFNSIGHRAWASAISKRPRLEVDKLGMLCEKLGLKKKSFFVSRVVGRAKMQGLKPEDLNETWIEDQSAELELYRTPDLADVRRLLTSSIDEAYGGLIDFDDQLYMSTRFGGVFDKYKYILIDEAQDISPIQADMIAKLGLKDGSSKFSFIGDPCQAIYGWRGAGTNSMNELASSFHTKALPLTVSFRCATNIVTLAKRFVSHIESAEGAPSATINDTRDSGWSLSLLRPGDVALCRNNAPLIALALRLAVQGIPVHVVGKEFGKAIFNLLSQHAEGKTASRHIYASAEEDLQWKLQKALAEGRTSLSEKIEERLDSIAALFSMAPPDWPSWQAQMQRLFAVPHGAAVSFSTIHKAKGLEWPRVFLLDFDLIPSPKAKDGWQLEQEHNLAYVALTRVKGAGELTFINSAGLKL